MFFPRIKTFKSTYCVIHPCNRGLNLCGLVKIDKVPTRETRLFNKIKSVYKESISHPYHYYSLNMIIKLFSRFYFAHYLFLTVKVSESLEIVNIIKRIFPCVTMCPRMYRSLRQSCVLWSFRDDKVSNRNLYFI